MNEQTSITFAIPTRSGGVTEEGGVRVEASARGEAGQIVKLTADPGDVVEIEIVNGPTLVLAPENAKELFDAQRTPQRARSDEDKKSDSVAVPTRLAWRDDGRRARGEALNELGQVALHAFKVVKETVSSKGANVVASITAAEFDRRAKAGFHRLSVEPAAAAAGKPLLVLIHGAFTTSRECFGRLWDHPGLIADLQNKFDIYAFDHPTLTRGPLENALELAKALPTGTPVTFLTHSRGGLVAEALALLADGRPPDTAWLLEKKYQAQLDQLQALHAQLKQQPLNVARVVRVACPARGTLLASKRLDAYLSVLKWGLTLAQVPVAKEVAGFLAEVAKRRTKPEELPGLEAMMPESGFIQWLHQSDRPIAGDLRVVAGDLQADSVSSWLKTLLSDAFFWTDSDLIVQTRSMYSGRPRQGGQQFFLDRSGNVSHFKYFANPLTALAIRNAIIDDKPDRFRPIGRLSSEGQSSTGSRGEGFLGPDLETVLTRSKSPNKPAVIILPGILGSQLDVNGERVWLSWSILDGLDRLAWGTPNVEARGWMGPFYDGLARYLADSHEVIRFEFDWRKPIEEEAERLAKELRRALDGRTGPVRILAHSLGGLVARTVEKQAPQVWNDFLARDGSRFVMLGTPNAGSWAPMQVLSGDNTIGNIIAAVGALFHEREARALFARLPGFIQLQAGLLESRGLEKEQTWIDLADADRTVFRFSSPWHNLELQKHAADWGIPSQKLLSEAYDLHSWLAQQDLRRYGNRVVMVVGKKDETPSGYELDKNEKTFEYEQTDRGDGTVTLASALLPGVRAFQVDVEHSQLPIPSHLHAGYLSLLETGTPEDSRSFTSLFSTRGGPASPSVSAGNATRAPRRGSWDDSELDELGGTLTVPSRRGTAPASVAAPALKISVINGDLTFVSEPLMLGHYRSLVLSGAEKVIDDFLNGIMTKALRLRNYATQPGESTVFENRQGVKDDPHAAPRPAGVVVVGLGAEGDLKGDDLVKTVREGVVAYAIQLASDPQKPTSFELAATLIASGGLGIEVAVSARAVAQGVHAANERLLKENAPLVSKLHVIEVYEDRATEALRELRALGEYKPGMFEVERWLTRGINSLPRPLTPGYRGASYDMVSVLNGPVLDGQTSVAFAVDSRRARTEVRSTATQLPLLQALIDQAEADRRGDQQLGRSLFRILVPAELDSFFAGSDAVLLQLDDATAGMPWELLSVDTDDQDDLPWSIRAKLVRKLQTRQFRENPKYSGPDAQVLVIGDPLVDDRSRYPELVGARTEAQAVASVLSTERLKNRADAVEIVNSLLGDDYAIVHVAGHGKEDGSGVVLSGKVVLGADLVKSMRRVPDLVFVNTCHSARQSMGDLPARAATLARGLIEAGVRCVIATGWAVDDDAAEHFAKEFYANVLRRKRFLEATSEARESTWKNYPNSNTWAAYQCYGDPDWVWHRASEEAESESKKRDETTTIVSPDGLCVALKTLATLRPANDDEQLRRLERLRALEAEHLGRWGKRGDVAEAFADAWANVGARDQAVTWYERAAHAEEGGTFKSLEQLFNLRVRKAAEKVELAYRALELGGGSSEALGDAIDTATEAFDARKGDLKLLSELPATSERGSLLGSAWKRQALVCYARYARLQGELQPVQNALENSRRFYEQAAERAEKNVGYPRLNAMTAKLVNDLVSGVVPALKADEVAQVRRELEAWAANKTEFWPYAQLIEIEIYEGVCRGNLANAEKKLLQDFEKLWRRIANPQYWGSVRDQAAFVLRPYGATPAGSTEAEKNASTELRNQLERYATKATT